MAKRQSVFNLICCVLATLCLVAATSLVSLVWAASNWPPLPVPEGNPITEPKRVLGKILFWEQQLSSDNSTACGSCHQMVAGGSDSRQGIHPGDDTLFNTADDVTGSPGVVLRDNDGNLILDPLFATRVQITNRASPTMINAAYSHQLFWDGRADQQFVDPINGQTLLSRDAALETQALGPILSSVEMAFVGRTWADVSDKLSRVRPLALARDIPQDMQQALARTNDYSQLFRQAFGDEAITPARIAMAIATYQRTLISDQTPWDRFMAGDQSAMTPQQQAGWQVFQRQGLCVGCHRPPLFTDNQFHNIGLRHAEEDLGRFNITGEDADRGAFKTPTLRNVGLKRSLMHVGWVRDVADAIGFYAANPVNRRHQQFRADQSVILSPDPAVTFSFADVAQGLRNPQDRANLVDFITNALTDPRVANQTFPFDQPRLSQTNVAQTGPNDGQAGNQPGTQPGRQPGQNGNGPGRPGGRGLGRGGN